MRKTKLQRAICLLLALLLLVSGATLAVGAENVATSDVLNPSVTDKTIADYREELESISYGEYSKDFKGYNKATETVIIDAIADLDKSQTTLEFLTDEEWARLVADKSLASSLVGIYETEYDGVKALYTPGDGEVTFTAKNVTEGLYAIRIYYWPVEGKSASIERELYINGSASFKEARSLTLPKGWDNAYETYEYTLPKDANAQELIDRAKALGLTAKMSDVASAILIDLPDVWTPEASAFLMDELGVAIDHDIASALYGAISSDSGGFRYDATKPETHIMAARCLETGIDFAEINRMLFESKTKAQVNLIKTAYNNLELLRDGKFALVAIRPEEVIKCGATEMDFDCINSIPREIGGVLASAVIRQKADGVKVSMRSNTDIDVAEIAKRFGGGGHYHAAGFTFGGSFDEAVEATRKCFSEIEL